LLDGPSPLHRADRFADALGGGFELWLKREDLLPLAFGGNKLRNLEYLLGEAIAEGADTLVTAGRRWSNHCRLTAAAGARAGLRVHLVLSGPPGPGGDGPNVRIERLLGATIQQLATADRAERDAAIARVVDELRAAGRKPYVIPVGGSSVTGTFGQLVAGGELATQVAAWPAPPDLVVVPSATGGTQAGLLVGLRAAGLDTRIVGVVVARPVDELRPAIEASVRDLGSLVGITPPSDRIELDDTQIGGGYGVPSAAASVAASLLARTEAVLTDPIYTAKAVAWVVAAAAAGELAGRRVVFWHAGGTLGLFEPLEDR
jgi:1-aminocyclopropane-1-carboxylate deaminase/D-cysteine desulfhydrase-like pyridoxal-dependent ACC family enzyme